MPNNLIQDQARSLEDKSSFSLSVMLVIAALVLILVAVFCDSIPMKAAVLAWVLLP